MSRIQNEKTSTKKKQDTARLKQDSFTTSELDEILNDASRNLPTIDEQLSLSPAHKRNISVSQLAVALPAVQPKGDGDIANRLTTVPADALHHFLRFSQYLRRYDRRKEKLASLRIKVDYEKAHLKDCERWREESFQKLHHEMHEAQQTFAAAQFTKEVPHTVSPLTSLEKVSQAMDRSRKDQEEVVAQEKRVVRLEDQVKVAEGRLNRVMDSMIVSAKKSIETSDFVAPDSDDLISDSTKASSKAEPVSKRPAPPAIVEEYFEKLGEKNIMFERMAEIEWDRREDLIQRDIALDQSSDPGADRELSEANRLADANYEREMKAAYLDYDKAFAAFERIQDECNAGGIDPYIYRNNTDDDMSDVSHDKAPPPRRQTSDRLPLTMDTIGQELTRLTPGHDSIAIGPSPDDPQGLVATEVYFDALQGQHSGVQAQKSVELWLDKTVDKQPTEVDSAHGGDSRQALMHQSPPQLTTSPAADDLQAPSFSLDGPLENGHAPGADELHEIEVAGKTSAIIEEAIAEANAVLQSESSTLGIDEPSQPLDDAVTAEILKDAIQELTDSVYVSASDGQIVMEDSPGSTYHDLQLTPEELDAEERQLSSSSKNHATTKPLSIDGGQGARRSSTAQWAHDLAAERSSPAANEPLILPRPSSQSKPKD